MTQTIDLHVRRARPHQHKWEPLRVEMQADHVIIWFKCSRCVYNIRKIRVDGPNCTGFAVS